MIPLLTEEYGFNPKKEVISFTDASLINIVNSKEFLLILKDYCGFEAGVRNLRKCIDRVYRKVVSKLVEINEREKEETTTLAIEQTKADIEKQIK